jgi:hypothetical protein
MSSNTEGRSAVRGLLSSDEILIEVVAIAAVAFFAAFCASWEFVQTWTPRVTTWSVIEPIHQDAMRTYWSLLVVPYLAIFAYLTSSLVAWDKGKLRASDPGRVSRRTPLLLMAFVMVFWAFSVIVYMTVFWALAIPLPDLVDVMASSILPFASLILTCCVVLARLVMVDERGSTNGAGLALMTVLLLAAALMLARYWFV